VTTSQAAVGHLHAVKLASAAFENRILRLREGWLPKKCQAGAGLQSSSTARCCSAHDAMRGELQNLLPAC